MTYKDLYMKENCGLDPVKGGRCAKYHGYIDRCPHPHIYDSPIVGSECHDCWNREISDEKVGQIFKPTIKDSGDRTEFSTGAVRDLHAGKGRMDLLPWAAIMEVSKHCENGAEKYGEHNVDKGIPVSRFCDSGARHLAKYIDGMTDEPHLLAAVWNLLWAVQMELKHPELCDIPWNKDSRN